MVNLSFLFEFQQIMLILIKQWGRPLPSLSKGRGTAAAVDEYALYFFKQFDKSPFGTLNISTFSISLL